jgi:hypothetical protein
MMMVLGRIERESTREEATKLTEVSVARQVTKAVQKSGLRCGLVLAGDYRRPVVHIYT